MLKHLKSENKVKFNLTMLFTSFPLPAERNYFKRKIYVSLFNGIKAFSCFFGEKERKIKKREELELLLLVAFPS